MDWGFDSWLLLGVEEGIIMLEENMVLIVDGGGQKERLFISDDVSDWCVLQIGSSDDKEDK